MENLPPYPKVLERNRSIFSNLGNYDRMEIRLYGKKTSQTGSGNKSAGIINLTTLSQRKARCRGKDAMPVFYHHKVNRCVHGRFRSIYHAKTDFEAGKM